MKYSLIILVVLFLFGCGNKRTNSIGVTRDSIELGIERRGDSFFVNGKYDSSIYGIEATTPKPKRYFLIGYEKTASASAHSIGSFYYSGDMASMKELEHCADSMCGLRQKGHVVILSICEVSEKDFIKLNLSETYSGTKTFK